jgi:hypothetical protein
MKIGHFGASAAGPFHGYTGQINAPFQTIDFPGATDTRCNGINVLGQIAGRFTNSSGVIHGFTAK